MLETNVVNNIKSSKVTKLTLYNSKITVANSSKTFSSHKIIILLLSKVIHYFGLNHFTLFSNHNPTILLPHYFLIVANTNS